jgi:peptidoglycan/xylan/chitin deacetylase (PgdA/CDA1 family)
MIALMYHDVVPIGKPETSGFNDPWADHYKFDEAMFQAHLDAIASLAGREAIGTLTGTPAAAARSPVLLTFDDGGVSADAPIATSLEARGWRGHFFVTTDCIDKAAFLNDAQIADLHRRGHIIGSHSCSHPTRMAACSREQLRTEWRDSVQRLSAIIGAPVTTASVPGGYYSRAVAETAAEAGIRHLFNSEPTTRTHTVDGCTVIGRFALVRGMGPSVAAGLAAGRPWPRWRQASEWKLKKAVKAVGGPVYLKIAGMLRGR